MQILCTVCIWYEHHYYIIDLVYIVSSSVWTESRNRQSSDECSHITTSALGEVPFTHKVHICITPYLSYVVNLSGLPGSLKTNVKKKNNNNNWLYFTIRGTSRWFFSFLALLKQQWQQQQTKQNKQKQLFFFDVFYYKHKPSFRFKLLKAGSV